MLHMHSFKIEITATGRKYLQQARNKNLGIMRYFVSLTDREIEG
jgi:hypothetical protein